MNPLSIWALGVAMGVALVPAWRLIRDLLEARQDGLLGHVDMRTKERLEMHARERERG